LFFFSSRRRHTRLQGDWSSDVCSSDLIHALADLAAQQKIPQLFIHAFLDGRDTPPKSALTSLAALENKLSAQKCGRIASIIGRRSEERRVGKECRSRRSPNA